MATHRVCSIDGCGKPTKAHGWCRRHYERWRAHGSPVAGGTGKGAARAWILAHVEHVGADCLIWPFRASSNKGYGTINWDGRTKAAHTVMCALAHGSKPTPSHEAAHSCGNGHNGCVHPKHLRWDTRSGNHADKVAHGTDHRGAKNPSAKLSERAVRDIRERVGSTPQALLALEYGVSISLVSAIALRKRWAWLG